MAGRGQQATSEQVKAILAAQGHIARFKGGPGVRQPAAHWTRRAVRDALFAAPQPLTFDWVKSSLAITAGLAQWGDQTGQPMTRAHLLSKQVRQRFVFQKYAHLSPLTQRTYQSRLDVIATALLAPPATPHPSVVGLGLPMLDPTTSADEVALWNWTLGLRPSATRRRRVQAILALCLGAGARRKDLAEVAARDITRDADGVHIHFHGDDTDRIVTCRNIWEDRLWALVEDLAPDRSVTCPRSTAPVKAARCDNLLNDAQEASPAPAHFTMITLRSGWMVRHIGAGTPLHVLMPAARIEQAVSFVKLLPHVPAPTSGDRTDALRKA